MLSYRYVSICKINGSVRSIKTAPVKKDGKKYTETIRLPRTAFPAWLNSQRAAQRDKYIIETCGFSELYSWQRENVNGSEFVLHDGPPYANGLPHMGHAINKILKDIIIRHKLLKGHKIHYVPGWDCHGLPIELKALSGTVTSDMKPVDIRNRARKFATRTIEDQLEVFRLWGVMADWKQGCYRTFDKSYVKNQLRQFWNLYDMGLVYRDLKPVYWSPSSETALAEAELVYNESHQSTAVAVRFKLSEIPASLSHHISCHTKSPDSSVYLVIWTTTPWTLPANQAIAFNPRLQYSLVTTPTGEQCIFATDTLPSWSEKLNHDFKILASFTGSVLEGSRYVGRDGRELPLISGDHVTGSTGTGLVHTAPAHGHDDFLLAKVHGLPVECHVNEFGEYGSDVDKCLVGSKVLNSNDKVIKLMSKDILHKEIITHSYPYDWRTNKPVIIKASQQWFFDTDSIKSKALEVLKDVEIVPGSSGLSAKIEKRPYWCISRQRVWGVPIPALYNSGEPLVNKELVEHYCDLIDQEGTDFWWTLPTESLLPNSIAQKLNINIENVSVGKDILDIWFDSGLSWSSVLEGRTADLYLEGLDQFTGWFQSSLLTSVALEHKAPYKKIFVHGFAVDEEGKKMSKSVGNVVDPQDIVSGRLDQGKSSGCGVDLLRWWVGAHGHHVSVPVSSRTLSNSKDSVYKMRNVAKFLLGALNDFPREIPRPKLRVLDNYALHSLLDFKQQVDEHYESFQFNKVCSTVNNYMVNNLSAFYLHLIKDRLYCEEEGSEARRSVQFVLYHILEGLLTSVAPILPILVEEIYSYHPHNPEKKAYFMSERISVDRADLASQYKVEPVIEQALAVKAAVLKDSPLNCNSWQLTATVHASPCVYRVLRVLQKDVESDLSELSEILQLSNVHLVEDKNIDSFTVEIKASSKHLCDRCRRFTSSTETLPCKRCQAVLHHLVD